MYIYNIHIYTYIHIYICVCVCVCVCVYMLRKGIKLLHLIVHPAPRSGNPADSPKNLKRLSAY